MVARTPSGPAARTDEVKAIAAKAVAAITVEDPATEA
jgi:hypothetical protein